MGVVEGTEVVMVVADVEEVVTGIGVRVVVL